MIRVRPLHDVLLTSICRVDDGKTTHGYQHTDAMFGTPFEKDRMITGFMYYMTPNETAPGCSAYKVQIDADQSNSNQVFLVDRGVCRFSLKVKIAQSEGAEAVVIGNNVCLQADYDFVKQKHGATVAASFCCDDILDAAGKIGKPYNSFLHACSSPMLPGCSAQRRRAWG